MKLLKVSVPNFRNLQNVELTFEPELSPAVFPIASQNGGGKSTLLQLIFTLFHCSIDESKNDLIENLLRTEKRIKDKISNNLYSIAKFDILSESTIIKISFNLIPINDVEQENINQELIYLLRQKDELLDENETLLMEVNKRSDKEQEEKQTRYSRILSAQSQSEVKLKVESKLGENSIILNELYNRQKQFNEKNNFLVSSLVDTGYKGLAEDTFLFYCQIENEADYEFAIKAFASLGENIFLAAPSTQPFLFLDKESKKELLNNLGFYSQILFEYKEELENLYLYSQLTISELIETFTRARDKDWKQALESNNLAYGSNIKKLTDDFHNFLGHDKYILPTPELDSIVVQKQISETVRIELEPEDLSHGELRRLGLYAWIKYNIPENSIILIDEIENALHPDWQYNIADELASWGDNQYLLATHSFHLCEALTPKHVKEIEPKMCKPASEAVDND